MSEGYGISPNRARHAKDLTDKEKLLLIEISCLCAEAGFCWASNTYIGERLNCSGNTIRANITTLVKKGYLIRELDNIKGNDTKRKIFMGKASGVYSQIDGGPPRKSTTNIYNNLLKEIKEYKSAIKGGDYGGDVKTLFAELSNIISSLDGEVKSNITFDIPNLEELGPLSQVVASYLSSIEKGEEGCLKLIPNKPILINQEYIELISSAIMQKGVIANRVPKTGEIPSDVIAMVAGELDNMFAWYIGNVRVVRDLKSTAMTWFGRYFKR